MKIKMMYDLDLRDLMLIAIDMLIVFIRISILNQKIEIVKTGGYNSY